MQRFSNEKIIDLLSLSPNATAIYSTDQLIIQTANDAMLNFWGRDRSIIGLRLEDAIPELKEGQSFIDLIRNVWNTGTYEAKDTPANLLIDGELQMSFFDFTYQAIPDHNGVMVCILHTAMDVTERNLNRQALLDAKINEEDLLKEKNINEELAAINEELNSTNEDIYIINEYLHPLAVVPNSKYRRIMHPF